MKATADEAAELLAQFGIESEGDLASISPIDGKEIGRVAVGDPERAAAAACDAFEGVAHGPGAAPRRARAAARRGACAPTRKALRAW